VELLSCLKRPITLAPFHMTQHKQESANELGHYHRRNEIVENVTESTSCDIIVDDLFIKAKEHVKSDSKFHYLHEQAQKYDISKFGNIVGLIGQAGIGKTTLCKTVLNRMMKEGLFDAEYVFYLQFRDVNYKAKTNLFSFLAVDLPWAKVELRRKAVLAKLSKNKQIVMIFDGLDEAILNYPTPNKNIQHYEEALPEFFITNLLNGSIFPLAKKLFTSRPRQIFDLPSNLKPHYIVNITGLNVKAQKQICKEICGDNAERIFNHILHHPQIGYYCYVPANCILVMHAMGKILELPADSSIAFPTTITGVLVIVIGLFSKTSHARVKFCLEKLANLAWEGLKEQKFNFTEEDLTTSGLTSDEMSFFLVTILATNNKLPFFRGDPKKITYFAHPLIQEFFAALKLILFSSSADFRKLFLGRNFGKIQLSKPTFDLFDSKWEVVAKFLFGLCNVKILQVLRDQFPSVSLSLPDKTKVLCNFVLRFFPSSALPKVDYFQQIMQYCTWAYEIYDDKFASRIAKRLDNELRIEGKFLPNDVAPIHYVLQHRKKNLYLDTTQFDTWFVGDSLNLFLEEIPALAKISVRFKIFLTIFFDICSIASLLGALQSYFVCSNENWLKILLFTTKKLNLTIKIFH